jgi:hypothetical protein
VKLIHVDQNKFDDLERINNLIQKYEDSTFAQKIKKTQVISQQNKNVSFSKEYQSNILNQVKLLSKRAISDWIRSPIKYFHNFDFM